MNNYQLLLELKQNNYLKLLIRNGIIPNHFLLWMDICEYHLAHPSMSQFQMALHFRVSKKTIWRAYQLLNQQVI